MTSVSAGGLIGFGAALLPITQRAERDVIPRGELFLGEIERPANQLGLWGVRFIRAKSAPVKGCASGSSSAA